MKAKTWLALGAVTLAGTLYLTRDDAPDAPDTSEPDLILAAHFQQLCKIAGDNVETPEPGIRAFGRYMGAHADSMFGSWGGMIATIERIPDDEAHDARAYLARERIREPLRACAEDFENFFNAVEEDEEAVAVLNHGLERLNRTLEIITGESAGSVKTLPATWRARLRTLPALLVR
ncbi:MAG: hypothetical protein H0T79_00090 [Deltaproteobacteria bacterium]|nr:hypothetical protein [Deltaproteobacteria bacterium]